MQNMNKILGIIPVIAFISLSILIAFIYSQRSPDDPLITYRYARNIAEGKGFTYNPDEPFLGTTAPFYALILAFFGVLGFNIPIIGNIFSPLSLGLASVFVYLLATKKGYPIVGLLCGLFLLLNPWVSGTFGMEIYFQIFLIMGAFYFYDQQKYTLTTIFCVLAFLIRADGIIASVILSIDYIITNKKIPKREIMLFIVLCAPVFIFYFFHFNTFLPATLEAKQAQYDSGLWMGFWPGVVKFIFQRDAFMSFLPLIIVGGIFLLLSARIWVLVISWGILHTLGYILLGVPFYRWYSIPLVVSLMVMSGFSFRFVKYFPRLLHNTPIKFKLFKKSYHPYLKGVHGLLAVVLIFFIAIPLYQGFKSHYHLFKNKPLQSPKMKLYIKAGRWFAENTPPHTSIAFIEIGYLGYYSQRRIIDLSGLVTPGVSKHIRNRDFQWAVKKYSPDYFVFNPQFSGWIRILNQPWFKKYYKQIKEIEQKGFKYHLKIYKKTKDFKFPRILTIDAYQMHSDIPVGEIIQGFEVGQSFYCHHNNLARIQVMMATYNRKNNHDVIFHLKSSPLAQEDIYKEKFNASNVLDNAYRTFDFPPLLDSKGKNYYFFFESPQSHKGDAVTLWSTSKNHYKKGSLYIKHEKSQGDLRFITYYYENNN